MNDIGKQDMPSTSAWDSVTVPPVNISHEAMPIVVPTPIKMVPTMSMEHPVVPVPLMPQTPHVCSIFESALLARFFTEIYLHYLIISKQHLLIQGITKVRDVSLHLNFGVPVFQMNKPNQ